jgi:uncharacterized membrane-anchored protein YhcB (DUF1043 family)
VRFLRPLDGRTEGDNLRRKEVRPMSKTLQHSAVILAVVVGLVAGSVVMPLTSALAVEVSQGAQGSGIELASLQQEVSSLRAEIAKISRQVNGGQEPSERPLSGYCQSLSETVRASGVIPGQCLNLK